MNSANSTLFDVFTTEAIVFKAMSKVLASNFIDATFLITEAGIFIQECSGGGSIIFEAVLRRNAFLGWRLPQINQAGSILCIGFSTADLKTALDRITKTDSFRMYVTSQQPEILRMEITTRLGVKTEKFITTKKTNLADLIPPSYDGLSPTVVVQSGSFKKTTTDANKNSKPKIRVMAQLTGLIIEGTGSQLRGLKDNYGEWDPKGSILYSEEISTQKFHSFSEMAVQTISKNIQIYAGDVNPLRLRADAGSLGSVSMYLQPDAMHPGT